MSTKHTVVCDGCGLEVGVATNEDGAPLIPTDWYGVEVWQRTDDGRDKVWTGHVCMSACVLKAVRQITQ